tara:strand:+ start:552 stop:863 length:312 start_codon:yes stop_codon:yes gene_type:complete
MITANGLIQLGFISKVDFFLQDDSDGKGVYIKKWSSDKAQPSKSEIEAAEVEWQTAYDAQEYARKRKAEYDQLNQFEMQFDDDRDGTTTWVDKINEIKARYPK